MDVKLGAHIAALRKAKGMTQEQLARAVGVSAPAVSKWETDASCPDIALLCPLARALGTNVDTLLRFEEALPDETLAARVNEIVELSRAQGLPHAEAALAELLHAYPSSLALKYNAALVMDTFALFFPGEDPEKRAGWQAQKRRLLEDIYAGGASAYWQSAVSQLATLAILEGDLDRGERLLGELPEQSTDPTLTWVQLHLKRGEAEKALAVTQKRLYLLVSQVQTCLIQLMSPSLEPDPARALEICLVYRGLEPLFGLGGGMSAGLLVELYQRTGQTDLELDSLVQFAQALTGGIQPPNPLLFSTVGRGKEAGQPFPPEMKKLLLENLQTDGHYAPLREDPRFIRAVETLRAAAAGERGGPQA